MRLVNPYQARKLEFAFITSPGPWGPSKMTNGKNWCHIMTLAEKLSKKYASVFMVPIQKWNQKVLKQNMHLDQV